MSKIETIMTSSSFLAGLCLTALTTLDVQVCSSNECLAQYYTLEITTVIWILAFSMAFVISVNENIADNMLHNVLRFYVYLGFIGLVLVLLIGVIEKTLVASNYANILTMAGILTLVFMTCFLIIRNLCAF